MIANTLLQNVYVFETIEAEGEPFASITPSANESEYDTTTENTRVYAFTIRLFKERGGETDQEDAEAAMRELVDSVLDDMDKNWDLSGLPTPAGYTYLFMEAAPAAWGYVEREVGLRLAEINLRVHFHIDTNNI